MRLYWSPSCTFSVARSAEAPVNVSRFHRLSTSGAVFGVILAALGLGLPAAATGADDVSEQRGEDATKASVERPDGLTADLVYAVLVGDVAVQRRNPRMAFTHYLLAARLAGDVTMAQLAARSALALDDRDAEQRAVKLWLELAPESLEAEQLAAYVAIKADDIPVALGHLRRVIAMAHEREKDGYLHAARLLADLDPPERRLELLRGLIAEDGETAEAYFALALVAAGAELYDDAVAATRRTLELRPNWSEAQIFLVRLLLGQEKRAAARETLETFVAQNQGDRGLRLLYAQLLVDEREFGNARGVFEDMLVKAPKDPDVLFALGILSLQLDDLGAGRDYFTRLNDGGQRKDDAAYYLGQVEEEADNLDLALSWYQKVAGANAGDAQVRIARLLARKGQVERAREILYRLRDDDSEDAVTLYLVEAEILRGVGRNDDAMAVYGEALVRHPENADILYARGLHAVNVDRLDIMEADLRAIIDKDPNHADALNALGYSLADHTERYQEALSYLERAQALKPEEPAILDSMGWVLYRLGRVQEALDYLRRAAADNDDAEIAAHLGEVLWAAGEREEARRVWQKALSGDPEHAYLLRVMGRHRVTSTDPAK